jgi:hypothetical protein
MAFPNPIPITAIAHILYTVEAESPHYNLFDVRGVLPCHLLLNFKNVQENCWFYVSIIQEIFAKNFGAQYEIGSLNHSGLASECRARVIQTCQKDSHAPQTASETEVVTEQRESRGD